MNLEPVTHDVTPGYPRRSTPRGCACEGMGRWLRRAAVAACASSALWLGGCYGATPFDRHENQDDETFHSFISDLDILDEPPPIPDEPEVMPGAAPAPAFWCGTSPEWSLEVPGYFEGNLCGEEPAFASFRVSADGSYSVVLTGGAEYTQVDVVNPAGEVVASIGPDEPSVGLEMTAGEWRMIATPAAPDADTYSWFEVRTHFFER